MLINLYQNYFVQFLLFIPRIFDLINRFPLNNTDKAGFLRTLFVYPAFKITPTIPKT